ncbi:hypothetical protein BLA29_009307 [Euroglyphus maynei]|uniref:Protein KRI1 homolog n=1 Tax=Euroglyphus maynei TaxID=6958 RepID=A0A1Y3AY18_EURMA|nr:hypothetical protein BLA29_009307 [Euroglyphus maynei]
MNNNNNNGGGNSKKRKKNKREIKQHKDIMADDDIGLYDDIVGGDLATRFRYRMVEPNDFGLTDEEILMADDKELNRWCSLKKMTQYRSKEQEQYERKVYQQKSRNNELKRKILKSIYSDEQNDDDGDTDTKKNKRTLYPIADQMTSPDEIKDDQLDNDNDTIKIESTKKRRRRKRSKTKSKLSDEIVDNNKHEQQQQPQQSSNGGGDEKLLMKKSRKRRRSNKKKQNDDSNGNLGQIAGVSVQRLKAYGLSNREMKRMKK